ncbi:MAG: 1,4-dihydroxy-6-naphthoate synthase [Actinobacteria bacterium]|nr:1,4-dihydroxy-6-naphthoate synthase [Actinomycetota bacterium]
MGEHILYMVDRSVATITINRPRAYNAFNSETLSKMTEAFHAAGGDRNVGVIVLTGAGDKAFCAGGDVNWEKEGGLVDGQAEHEMKVLYESMRATLKPVIARINGYCIGGGHHLAYFCDLSIAADHAIFGQNGPRVASPAQGWLVSYLVRVVGAKRAREMWMLCRRYPAAKALEWGLVNAVVSPEELDAEVRKWCDEILALSPTALKVLKRSFDEEYSSLREAQDNHDFLDEINPDFYKDGEQQEGAAAFLEKRIPDFSRWR